MRESKVAHPRTGHQAEYRQFSGIVASPARCVEVAPKRFGGWLESLASPGELSRLAYPQAGETKDMLVPPKPGSTCWMTGGHGPGSRYMSVLLMSGCGASFPPPTCPAARPGAGWGCLRWQCAGCGGV